MTNYTVTYNDRLFQIDLEEQTRVVDFQDGKPVYGGYIQYNIRENGQIKGFVFGAAYVFDAIQRMVDFPNEAEAIHCRFD